MQTTSFSITKFLAILLLCGGLMVLGCEGTETREQVDDTVKEVVGQKDLEQYQQMKESLDQIEDQQRQRLQQIEEEGQQN